VGAEKLAATTIPLRADEDGPLLLICFLKIPSFKEELICKIIIPY
jgi:hypothetical protein